MTTQATTTEEEISTQPTQDTKKTTYVFFSRVTNKTAPSEGNTERLESNLASPTISDYIDDTYEPYTYQRTTHDEKPIRDSVFGSSFENRAKWHDPYHSAEDYTIPKSRYGSSEFKNFLDRPTTHSSLMDEIHRDEDDYLSTFFASSPTRSSDDSSSEMDDENSYSFGTTKPTQHRFGPSRSVEDEISMRDKILRSELGLTLESEKLTTPFIPEIPSRSRFRYSDKLKSTMEPYRETTIYETYSTYQPKKDDNNKAAASGAGASPVNITQSVKISGDGPGNKLFYNEYLQKATYDLVNGEPQEPQVVTTENPEEPTTSFKFVSIDVIKKHFTMNESKSFDDEETTTAAPPTTTADYHSFPGRFDDFSYFTEPIPTTTTSTTTTVRPTTARRNRGRSRFREPTWNSSFTRRRKVTTTTTTTTTPKPTTKRTEAIAVVPRVDYVNVVYHTTSPSPAEIEITATPKVEEDVTTEDYLKNFIASIESTTNSVHIAKSDDFWYKFTSTENPSTTNKIEEITIPRDVTTTVKVEETRNSEIVGAKDVDSTTDKTEDSTIINVESTTTSAEIGRAQESTIVSHFEETTLGDETNEILSTTTAFTGLEVVPLSTTTELDNILSSLEVITTTEEPTATVAMVPTTTTTQATTRQSSNRRRFSARYKKPTPEKVRQNRRKTTTTTAATSTVSEETKQFDVKENSTKTQQEIDTTTTEVPQAVVPLQKSKINSISTTTIKNVEKGEEEEGPSLARSDVVPVTDAYFSRSVNPTQAKKPIDTITTTPLSNDKTIKKSFVFNCFDKEINKFYSDPRDCRLFHYCTAGFSKNQLLDMKFVCDLGTYYDDVKRVCTKDMPERCL